ncbi:MAG: 5'/3'-nucleotidase SurE [Peptococcaceae bacterium]|jgi:5'-nucleotidase|nr:5'/3'-nucleotidase SurE [Peptococcaceae bacterium]MDH7525709.1 5'/3'-nucleotidase SurE [Peptococcaceae bacterium]
MLILVTNDDGILAPGLQILARQMKGLGEVAVVAPAEERSATGHGITVRDPIRIKRMNFEGVNNAWAVMGTPADCVKLAVQELIGKCGLVISGINSGPNLGTDVIYSGTVSAAIEGIVLGIPSIAVSLASDEYGDYGAAAEAAFTLACHLQKKKELLPPDTLLNVNVPPVDKKEIRGFKVTRLGMREYKNVFDRRVDPRGNVYFWLKGDLIPHDEVDPEIDVVAVEQNYVSVSPIHFDLTNYRLINRIKSAGFERLEIKTPG